MYLPWIFGVCALVWILLEHPQVPKPIRATLQPLICMLLVLCAWGASAVLGKMSMRLEANNMVKNLTRGLVTISASDYDLNELRQRLVRLNQEVVPTYEKTQPTRAAVEHFLGEYGIDYEAEIPME
jgi:hypothetical protein